MIKLFLADIDGCLAEPYRPYDLEGLARLRAWAARAEADPAWPRVSLCSGRAYAYVEAVAQLLALRAPVLFESGGGRFDLPAARIAWNPAFTPEAEAALGAVRAFFLSDVIPAGRSLSLDYGKRAQAGLVAADPPEIGQVLPMVRAFVTERFPDLRVYETPVSIDVVPAALTKAQALRWLCAQEGLTLAEVAFIGDTRGDAEAIAAAGLGFAPANAAAPARAVADVVTRGAVLEGVLEAYQACVAHNAARLEAA